ncbi:MAG: cation:proton antiporter, partial [Hyphomicrobiales bacterium]|nr:cation:proton antiporter [Hyphomicrobiales bacterium]
DPGAVIAIFRDVGAPARLTRLVEGEALLNDAAAIVLYTVLLGVIVAGRELDMSHAAVEFVVSFAGGAAFGAIAGRAFLLAVPWVRDDRLAEATLTVALAYLAYIAADRLFHVSGVVAVLAAGMTVSAFGRARIAPYNWSFLADFWEQLAFCAGSLVFLLASILVPKLLVDLQLRDLGLLVVLILAAFAARLAVLFGLLPLLSLARLTQPISNAYKLVIAWGGLRGALTLVLALSVTENPALPHAVQRFVAVLATGLVLFTLLVNGTTLRRFIHFLRLDRLSPVGQLLRDRVLETSYAEMSDIVRKTAEEHGLAPAAEARALAPYEAWRDMTQRNSAGQIELTERERVAISLAALSNQERMLVLEILASRAASAAAVQALARNAERLAEGARSGGRLGYKRAVEEAVAYPRSFRAAYFLYRRFGVRRFLAERLGERFETLLLTRVIVQRLAGAEATRSRAIFGKRVEAVIDHMLKDRLDQIQSRVDSLRRQYPDYLAAIEARILRQSALRREMERYDALYQEGLIASEVYRDLKSKLEDVQDGDAPPRFDLGLNTDRLIQRLDLFAGLDPRQCQGVRKLLRARFTVPNELIVRQGERGDAVYFIASGAVEVVLPDRRVKLGTGDFFGEMALITGEPRQADVRAQTYSRLLVLRKSDFDRFMAANSDVRARINEIAERRLMENQPAAATA